jgi:hypothetical protein
MCLPRRNLFEKKDISPIINAEASEGVDNIDSDGEDTFSLAPRSQKGNFLSHDENCSWEHQRVHAEWCKLYV